MYPSGLITQRRFDRAIASEAARAAYTSAYNLSCPCAGPTGSGSFMLVNPPPATNENKGLREILGPCFFPFQIFSALFPAGNTTTFLKLLIQPHP